MRILIVSEHASLQFGGEASLPLHYFRVLRNRNLPVWMIVHERTKNELAELFADDLDRIYFIKDTIWHKILWNLGKPLPSRVSYFTFGILLRLLTQISQRHLAESIIKEHEIDIVHQPIPVSPKEPSILYDLGVPVIIGPMNGGMSYPDAFKTRESSWIHRFVGLGRYFANTINIMIPGKIKATTLLIANERTKNALPQCLQQNQIIEIPENGVDLSIWNNSLKLEKKSKIENKKITIVYLGRLVNWKGIDLLLQAFDLLIKKLPEYSITLEIIGDGNQRNNLEQQTKMLGLSVNSETRSIQVNFRGKLSQNDCSQYLQQADMMVLPSLYECGGAVVLEAMAMKIPVIATNWGGPADYLDESCGILVNPDSQESFVRNFASAMEKLATNPDLRESMGENGYNKILKLYDWEKKVDQISYIYQKSCGKDLQIKEIPVKFP